VPFLRQARELQEFRICPENAMFLEVVYSPADDLLTYVIVFKAILTPTLDHRLIFLTTTPAHHELSTGNRLIRSSLNRTSKMDIGASRKIRHANKVLVQASHRE
jgi:hypothetical protein